ncbi:NADPH-dependent FMN reductase [Petrimonas sp.]|uniref:NADPH-dependent FMN reductase n=1 Tax=Petrimonas sp. TaxID=2023866 RepID=UPI003F51496F
MSKKKVAVLVGSLRKESFNRKVANQLIQLAPDSLELELVEIGQLPHYNEDLELNVPKEYTEFREKIKSFDGFLFVTPEYNRSVPSALKNAFDVGSRPYGQSVWGGKPGAVVSVSMSAIGGFGANHIVRQSMVFLNVPMMQQPEAYIGSAHTLFDESGNLVNEGTRDFLKAYIDAYAAWVNNF